MNRAVGIIRMRSTLIGKRENFDILQTHSTRFNDEDQKCVVEAVMPLVGQVFQGVDFLETAGVLFGTADKTKHLLFVVYDDDIVAFASYRECSVHNWLILYVSGVIVNPAHQGKSLFKILLDHMCEPRYAFITLTTQNPYIMAGVAHHPRCRKVWPQLGAAASPLLYEIAHALMPDEIFDNLIIRNATAIPMYAERPWSRDEKINDFFRQCVGECDRVFVVAELDG